MLVGKEFLWTVSRLQGSGKIPLCLAAAAAKMLVPHSKPSHQRTTSLFFPMLLFPDSNRGLAVLQGLFVLCLLVKTRRAEATNLGTKSFSLFSKANISNDQIRPTDIGVAMEGILLISNGFVAQLQGLAAQINRSSNRINGVEIIGTCSRG